MCGRQRVEDRGGLDTLHVVPAFDVNTIGRWHTWASVPPRRGHIGASVPPRRHPTPVCTRRHATAFDWTDPLHLHLLPILHCLNRRIVRNGGRSFQAGGPRWYKSFP